MDYNKAYQNSFDSYINIAEKLIKKQSKLFVEQGFNFSISYEFIFDEITDYKNHIAKIFEDHDTNEIYQIFRSRNKIFQKNPIQNIVEIKILPYLKKKNLLKKISISKYIDLIAKYEALRAMEKHFQNNNQLYRLMYKLDSFNKFQLKSYHTSITNTELYKKLNHKLYPDPQPSKTTIVKNENTEDVFLTVNEVAKLLNYAVPTIYDLKHKKKIPFYKNGSKLQFKKSEILEWMEKGKGITKSDIEEKANNYLMKNRF